MLQVKLSKVVLNAEKGEGVFHLQPPQGDECVTIRIPIAQMARSVQELGLGEKSRCPHIELFMKCARSLGATPPKVVIRPAMEWEVDSQSDHRGCENCVVATLVMNAEAGERYVTLPAAVGIGLGEQLGVPLVMADFQETLDCSKDVEGERHKPDGAPPVPEVFKGAIEGLSLPGETGQPSSE